MGWLWARLSTIYQLARDWLWAEYQLYVCWLWAGYGLPMGCLWLSISWLSDIYQLAIGWLWPKINTLQDIVIYYFIPMLDMAVSNTLDCSVFTRFLATGWLLAGYGPKSIHFKT